MHPNNVELWALYRVSRALDIESGREFAIRMLNASVPTSLVFGWQEGVPSYFLRGINDILCGLHRPTVQDYIEIGPLLLSHIRRIRTVMRDRRLAQFFKTVELKLSPHCSEPSSCHAAWKEIWLTWTSYRLANSTFMTASDSMLKIEEIRDRVNDQIQWNHGPICQDCFTSTVIHYADIEFDLDREVVAEEVESLMRGRRWCTDK